MFWFPALSSPDVMSITKSGAIHENQVLLDYSYLETFSYIYNQEGIILLGIKVYISTNFIS